MSSEYGVVDAADIQQWDEEADVVIVGVGSAGSCAAIEAAGLPFGSVGFDNFARDLQTVIDPIDPLNYAAAAAGNHPGLPGPGA